jgi:hypothetical protein
VNANNNCYLIVALQMIFGMVEYMSNANLAYQQKSNEQLNTGNKKKKGKKAKVIKKGNRTKLLNNR